MQVCNGPKTESMGVIFTFCSCSLLVTPTFTEPVSHSYMPTCIKLVPLLFSQNKISRKLGMKMYVGPGASVDGACLNGASWLEGRATVRCWESGRPVSSVAQPSCTSTSG